MARIDDRHIHVWGDVSNPHCIHCGCNPDQAHEADPVLYPRGVWPEWTDRSPTQRHLEVDETPLEFGSSVTFYPPIELLAVNTWIHLNGSQVGQYGGDMTLRFHRSQPFRWWQVRLIQWAFGWRVEQYHKGE